MQLGAFSSFQNAIKSKNQFSKTIDEVFIVTKKSDSKKLYLVIAGKFNKRESAAALRREIRQKFGHEGIVIQY